MKDEKKPNYYRISSSEATLIRNVRPSVRQKGGNVIFSAPIKDRRLKLLVNIPIIKEHN